MNKLILICFLFIGCMPNYQPYKYPAHSEYMYDSNGQSAIKIECRESNADCLQEAGFICMKDGYKIIHNESLELGSVTTASDKASALMGVVSISGERQSLNIQDHFLIIKCNSVDSIEMLKDLKKYRRIQEAKHYNKYKKKYYDSIGKTPQY